MSGNVNFEFTWRAKEALVKRAKEITPQTINMLLSMYPVSEPIIACIWHVFPEEIMDKIVTLDYWEKESEGWLPGFMEDYILKHGEKLLEKYSHLDMIVASILYRRPDSSYGTSGMNDAAVVRSPMTSPETILKYYKRFKRMPNKWKNRRQSNVVENIGEMTLTGKLDIVLHVKEKTNAVQERKDI
jgi:hypothetical protein